MGVNLNPYLHFDGRAAEALAFYEQALGGTASSTTFGEMGMEGPAAVRIMHGQVETDHGITLMCGDFPPDSGALERGNAMTIALSGDDAAVLRDCWDELSDGGEIETPLEKQMWGDEFGMCRDRFGVAWLVNIAAPTR